MLLCTIKDRTASLCKRHYIIKCSFIFVIVLARPCEHLANAEKKNTLARAGLYHTYFSSVFFSSCVLIFHCHACIKSYHVFQNVIACRNVPFCNCRHNIIVIDTSVICLPKILITKHTSDKRHANLTSLRDYKS